MATVFTIGHSTRSQEDFLALLKAHGIVRLEERLVVYLKLGDQAGVAWPHVTPGEVAVMQEDAVRATELIEEALSYLRSRTDREGIGWALNHLGHAAQIQGDYVRAARL